MKIAIDETITLEFDQFSLGRAHEAVEAIKARHPDRVGDVLNGVLTILLFRQIEQSAPGTMDRLMQGCDLTRESEAKK